VGQVNKIHREGCVWHYQLTPYVQGLGWLRQPIFWIMNLICESEMYTLDEFYF
jgi:hypothetical protein